ncbi:hypothetical protein MesoLj131a_62140 [Mesorhizobium sp. 131-2-1]|nr:hypothetical protein MesoLj131a_62140 [Mesorhizobium sp. 131-2-1]BCH04421.1 hypothetical protein MesoLj131b_64200 [Mesorhizobium sp. 131-2-5]
MNKTHESPLAALEGLLFDEMFIAPGGFGLCGIPELPMGDDPLHSGDQVHGAPHALDQLAGKSKDEIVAVTIKGRKCDTIVDQDYYIRQMGTGPIPASQRPLEKAGWSVKDLDPVKADEAFAAQARALNNGMGWDPSIFNGNGGAIAISHPIGASGGARVFNTLVFEIGGGMGVAMCMEAM